MFQLLMRQLFMLKFIYDNCQRSNTTLILSEVNDSPYKVIKRVGLVRKLTSKFVVNLIAIDVQTINSTV